jgi:hypothetical protein
MGWRSRRVAACQAGLAADSWLGNPRRIHGFRWPSVVAALHGSEVRIGLFASSGSKPELSRARLHGRESQSPVLINLRQWGARDHPMRRLILLGPGLRLGAWMSVVVAMRRTCARRIDTH